MHCRSRPFALGDPKGCLRHDFRPVSISPGGHEATGLSSLLNRIADVQGWANPRHPRLSRSFGGSALARKRHLPTMDLVGSRSCSRPPPRRPNSRIICEPVNHSVDDSTELERKLFVVYLADAEFPMHGSDDRQTRNVDPGFPDLS
jgi:hypothetical protein